MGFYDDEGSLVLIQNLYNNLLPILSVYFTGKIIRNGRIVQSSDFKGKSLVGSRIYAVDADDKRVAAIDFGFDISRYISSYVKAKEMIVYYYEKEAMYVSKDEISKSIKAYDCEYDEYIFQCLCYIISHYKNQDKLSQNYKYANIEYSLLTQVLACISSSFKKRCKISSYDMNRGTQGYDRGEVFFWFMLRMNASSLNAFVVRPCHHTLRYRSAYWVIDLMPRENVPAKTFIRIWVDDMAKIKGTSTTAKIVKCISARVANSFMLFNYFNMNVEDYNIFYNKGTSVTVGGLTFIRDVYECFIYYRNETEVDGVKVYTEVSNKRY